MFNQKTFKNEQPLFYIIATPIGNIEDFTFRAINVLKKEIDILLCEDTRVTKKLLNYYEIDVKTKSYHEYSTDKDIDNIIDLINKGNKLGLVSDAGMPGIADPGYKLIKKLQENNINVVVLPGACASINALIGSGAINNRFQFIGFLNKQLGKKEKEIKEILNYKGSTIIYESPHKLMKTLKIIKKIMKI